jgi:hypothetical protein
MPSGHDRRVHHQRPHRAAGFGQVTDLLDRAPLGDRIECALVAAGHV